MEVITIDSIAFQKLVEQLNRIESYVERTTELYRDIDDALEISTKDLMTIFCISESTLYRWRKGGSISFRYTETGGVRFSYSSLFMAIKCFRIKIPGMAKEEALKRLSYAQIDCYSNGDDFSVVPMHPLFEEPEWIVHFLKSDINSIPLQKLLELLPI